jgi:hypothetical protein
MEALSLDQVAVESGPGWATWNLDVREGTGVLQVTLYKGGKRDGKARCYWLDWDEAAQDWTGERVKIKDVRHLIPARLVEARPSTLEKNLIRTSSIRFF